MLPFDTLVLHKYRIQRSPNRRDGLLGKGTFGNVYLAHEELADRDVAIKELGLDSGDLETQQEEALRRFLTEGRLGLRVRHPNILEVYAIEPYEDGYLLVMELAESGDLKALLGKGRPDLARSVKIAEGIALGLQSAHERGIVHRDLKPGNVFMMQDGTPKVADFGVAHIPQAVGGYLTMTRTGFQPGTVIYMSPEQAYGRRVDQRSDIYSLAVMLFELLTGSFYVDMQKCRALAQSQSTTTPALEELKFFQAFMDLAFTGNLPRPSERNPAVPAWLDEVVMRGLAREPEDRWQSGAEFAAALRAGPLPRGAVPPPLRDADATLIEPLTPASFGNDWRNRARQTPASANSPASQPHAPPADLVPPPAAPRERATPSGRLLTDSSSAATPGAGTPAEAVYFAPPTGSRLAGARPPVERDPDATYIGGSGGPAGLHDPDATYVRRPTQPATNANTHPPVGEGSLHPGDQPTVIDTAPRAAVGSAIDFDEQGTQRLARAAGRAAALPSRAADKPTQIAPAARTAGSRKSLWLLIGVPIAALAAVGGVAAFTLGGGNKPKPAPPAVAQTAAATPTATGTAPAATSATPVGSPSPSPSATAAPTAAPKTAEAVSDTELLSAHPGATAVDRENIAGTGGDLGQVALLSQVAGANGGCPTRYFDLFHPNSAGTWVSVWDGAKLPAADHPLLPAASKSDAGCFPDAKLQVRPFSSGGATGTLVNAALADSQRVLALQWDSTKQQVVVVYDATFSVPGAQLSFLDADTPNAGFHLLENGYPPASSGLNPSYDRPIGQFAEDVVYQGDGFVPLNQHLTPYCLSGTLQTKSASALLLGCADGSPGGQSAAAVTSDTAFADGISFDDVQAGDDIALTLADASLTSTDALNALPAATSVQSAAALARKQAAQRAAQRSAQPAPTSAPVRTSQPVQPAAQPVQPAPQPVQPAPQPVQPAPAPVQPAPQPTTAPSGGGAGLGGGGGTGSGGAGLGGGSSSGGSTGSGGAGLGGGH